MRVSSLLLASLLVVASLLTSVGELSAAELQLPQVIRPGELFVVNLVPDLQADKQIRVSIDKTQLQFMGAVQGTPDLQINGDTEFDIRPESGNLAAQYGLRFLSLQASGTTLITYTDHRGEHKVAVMLTPIDASRGYSWLILAGGLVLLIVGVKLWRYQKTAPAMMSTKSLFMNYEELEKARKMYFPEEPENADKPPAQPAPVEEKKASTSAPAGAAFNSSSGSSTSKQKAVQTVNVASRLAQYGEDDDEPDAKVLKPQTVAPADKNVSVAPESQVAPVAPIVSGGGSALPAASVADGESTVPVMHATPTDASTVPAAKAVPEHSVSEDSAKTQPAHRSVKVPATEPPKPNVGMAPVVGELRKDTGQQVIRLKMVFAIEDEQGRTYEAESEVIKIGRRRDCQIVLTASEISREHVEVFLKKGKMMVKPLTTTNICRLNNNELKKATPITPGDKLNMGGTEFLVTKARSI